MSLLIRPVVLISLLSLIGKTHSTCGPMLVHPLVVIIVWQRFADLSSSFAAWHLDCCPWLGILSSQVSLSSALYGMWSSLCCLRKTDTCRRCRKCIVQFAYGSLAAVKQSNPRVAPAEWLSLWIIALGTQYMYIIPSSQGPFIWWVIMATRESTEKLNSGNKTAN